MPKRSNRFQSLITVINHCLAPTSSVEESALLIDKITGEKREVDICIRANAEPYPVLICLEVIDHRRRATTLWVEQMHSKHSSLGTNKLVLVSRAGFALPAIKKAAFYGIEAVTIKNALKTDWDLALKLIGEGVFAMYNLQLRCEAVFEPFEVAPAPLLSRVFLKTQPEPTNVGIMVNTFFAEPMVRKTIMDRVDSSEIRQFTLVYTNPEGTLFEKHAEQLQPLRELRIYVDVKTQRTPVLWSIGQYLGKELILAESMPADGKFCIAMKRNESGQVEGTLYRHGRVERLTGSQSK